MVDELRELTVQATDAAVDTLLKNEEDWEGWEFISDNNDVISSRKPAGDGYYYVRGQGDIEASVEAIARVLRDPEMKPRFDKMYLEGRNLYEFSDKLRISYAQFKAPWPVSNRDFVFGVQERNLDDGTLIFVCKSLEVLSFPPQHGVVRGEMKFGGYILRPNGPSSTKVTYMFHVDPKGSIPTFAINYTQSKQTENIHFIRLILA